MQLARWSRKFTRKRSSLPKKATTIILIGHEGHDEVIGTMGASPANMVLVEDTADVDAMTLPQDTKLAFLTTQRSVSMKRRSSSTR